MGRSAASPGCACDDNVVLFKRAALTAPSSTHFALSRSLFPLHFLCSLPSLSSRLCSFDQHECQPEVQRSGGKEREGGGVAPQRRRHEQCHCSRSIRTFTNFIPAKVSTENHCMCP
ncbi:unnamed protein product [Musa acuminata var. zebrina]